MRTAKSFLLLHTLDTTENQQVWFPGAHADVGGGNREHLIADLSLCWMAGEAASAGLGIDEDFLYDCFTLLDSPDILPELRLHFMRRKLLTVDRMKIWLNTTPHHNKEVLLSSANPEFLYHPSLWAEIREGPGPSHSSHKAFTGKEGEPPRKPLTALERKYWERCSWDRLLPLLVSRIGRPNNRGQSSAWKTKPLPQLPPSVAAPPHYPMEFECVSDYTQDTARSQSVT
ncbi:hypothetical protein FRC12_006409 [Ceratobasidium sp. 428]|nr:hypothetical protein FRC12_006409 [Ceratobasidium sp. 428]